MSFSCAGSTLTTLFGSGKKVGADCALGASSEASAAHVACREPLGLAAVVWKLAQQKAQQKAQQTLQEEDGGEKGDENEEPKEDEEDDEEPKEDDDEEPKEDDGEEPKEDDGEEPKEDDGEEPKEDDEEKEPNDDEEHEEEIKKDEEEPQEKDDEANQAPKREKQTKPGHAWAWAPDTALGFFVGAATSDRLPPHEPAVGYFRHGYRHSVAAAPVGLVECTSVESAVEAAGGDRLLFPRHDPAVGYFRHNFAPARSAAGFVGGEDERDEGGRVGTANNGDSGLKLFFHLCGGRSSSSNRKIKSEKL